MAQYNLDSDEQQRIVIATAIIGTVIALYALPATSADLWSITRGFMLAPATCAFLFLIGTGSYLKYKDPGLIGDLNIAHSVRRFFYNWMIDMFGTGFVLSIVFFTAVALGWDGKTLSGGHFWVGIVAGFTAAFLLMIASLVLWNRENAKEGKKR